MINSIFEWGKKYPAPAKLNLMLRVTGRRDDGYHLLQTVFQFIELSDWITFYPVEKGNIYLKNPLPSVPENTDLTIRAAQLLKAETNCPLGVCIDVEKNLPMGGGIGGGSSDAATVLVALNTLWQLNLSQEKLMNLGLRLGADVPIFIHGKAAWAEGVGEQLTDISIKEQWVVLIKPNCHVNTGEIFSAKELTRNSKSIKIADFVAGQYQNDCVSVVCQRYPLVESALLDLSNFGESRLTGTGACVFALFDSKEEAQIAYQSLQNKWQVYLTKTVNKSPLYLALANG